MEPKRLTEMLDFVEQRVELLRVHTLDIQQERDNLINVLSQMKSCKEYNLLPSDEREEVEIATQRLLTRVLAVTVTVSTPRNESQERALSKVNQMYKDLLELITGNSRNARASLQQHLNACLSEDSGRYNHEFQAALLECTADDQKEMRRKLEFWARSMDSA